MELVSVSAHLWKKFAFTELVSIYTVMKTSPINAHLWMRFCKCAFAKEVSANMHLQKKFL